MRRLLVLFLCLWLPLQGVAAAALTTTCEQHPGVAHGAVPHEHGVAAVPDVAHDDADPAGSSDNLTTPAQDCCHHLSAALPIALPALFGPPSPQIEPIALDRLQSFISELPKRPPLAAV